MNNNSMNNIYITSRYNHNTYEYRSNKDWIDRIEMVIKFWSTNYYFHYKDLRNEDKNIKNYSGERKGVIKYKIRNLKERIDIKNKLLENNNNNNLKGKIKDMNNCIEIYEQELIIIEKYINMFKLNKRLNNKYPD